MKNRSAQPSLKTYIFVVILSIVCFILFLSAALVLKISTPYSHILTALLTVFLGLIVAYLWPVGLWRWGILASSGFWLYFIAVFVSSLLHQDVEWLSLGEGLSVIAIATIGAGIGRQFSLARRTQNS